MHDIFSLLFIFLLTVKEANNKLIFHFSTRFLKKTCSKRESSVTLKSAYMKKAVSHSYPVQPNCF
jgi:hypothetical protein